MYTALSTETSHLADSSSLRLSFSSSEGVVALLRFLERPLEDGRALVTADVGLNAGAKYEVEDMVSTNQIEQGIMSESTLVKNIVLQTVGCSTKSTLELNVVTLTICQPFSARCKT